MPYVGIVQLFELVMCELCYVFCLKSADALLLRALNSRLF